MYLIVVDIFDLVVVEVNFDGIIYVKGVLVFKQFVVYVGLECFLVGLCDYFCMYVFGNVSFDDLLVVLEKVLGCDLLNWGEQWLKMIGFNIL